MKVYVLTINEVSEFEQFDHDPLVYDNIEDARLVLSSARENALEEYFDEDEGDVAIDKDREDYFALFNREEGWSHTHYEAQITECEVLHHNDNVSK